jgi:hypothetical protein
MQARADRSISVGHQSVPQQRRSLRVLAMSRQYLGLDFESSAQRDRQMRFGVEPSFLEQLAGESLCLLGRSFGLIEVVGSQCFARRPRESLKVDRIDAVLRAVGLKLGIGRCEIPLRKRGADVCNNIAERQG